MLYVQTSQPHANFSFFFEIRPLMHAHTNCVCTDKLSRARALPHTNTHVQTLRSAEPVGGGGTNDEEEPTHQRHRKDLKKSLSLSHTNTHKPHKQTLARLLHTLTHV